MLWWCSPRGVCPVCAWSLSHVRLFVTSWTVARQAPLSMEVLQARILEWVAMLSSRGSFQPRDQIQVSCIAGRFFTDWAARAVWGPAKDFCWWKVVYLLLVHCHYLPFCLKPSKCALSNIHFHFPSIKTEWMLFGCQGELQWIAGVCYLAAQACRTSHLVPWAEST